MVNELSYEQVREVCDPQVFGVTTTEEMRPLEGIIGL
jgi:hypothetical protein